MAMPAPWPKPSAIVDLPTDLLGMHILWRMVEATGDDVRLRRAAFIATECVKAARHATSPMATSSSEAMQAQPDLARALAEAWDWLEKEGLISPDPLRIQRGTTVPGTTYFVTRRGREIAGLGTAGLPEILARRRLGVDLHPKLENALRSLVQAGAMEEAAFKALREVEVEVRRLAGNPTDSKGRRLVGDALVTTALSVGGPLADNDAEQAEQLGLMFLFKGAFGAVRNPLGHTSVEWGDPTEAAEMVLLADLLMRQLSHIERRTNQRKTAGVEQAASGDSERKA